MHQILCYLRQLFHSTNIIIASPPLVSNSKNQQSFVIDGHVDVVTNAEFLILQLDIQILKPSLVLHHRAHLLSLQLTSHPIPTTINIATVIVVVNPYPPELKPLLGPNLAQMRAQQLRNFFQSRAHPIICLGIYHKYRIIYRYFGRSYTFSTLLVPFMQ